MSTYIYIIRDGSNPAINRHKVGSHIGTRDALIDEYMDILPNMVLELFREVISATELEISIEKQFASRRIPFTCKTTEKKSEWYLTSITELVDFINDNSKHVSSIRSIYDVMNGI